MNAKGEKYCGFAFDIESFLLKDIQPGFIMTANVKETCESMLIDCLINTEKIVHAVYYFISLLEFKHANI